MDLHFTDSVLVDTVDPFDEASVIYVAKNNL